jgi:NDP-sugar pyrophosphorylase family protein
MKNLNIIVLMAGFGSRLKSKYGDIPKPLIKVANKTLIEHSLETLNIDGNYIFITREYNNKNYNDNLSSILKNFQKDSIEIIVNDMPLGSAHSALYAKEYIKNDELIITNCDQHLNWDSTNFMNLVNNKNIDGALVLFNSKDPKHSFATIENNKVIRVSEKNPISSNALVGIHYWKNGNDFVESAEKLLLENIKNEKKEYYVSETYNYICKDKNVVPYFIEENSFMPLGTPEDIDIFLAKHAEYYTEKPKTIFCDIDGTILEHAHSFSNVIFNDAKLLNGVIQKFDEWDSLGYKIILTTARKESARKATEEQLAKLGLCWDQLIMGISSGKRILLNDKLLSSDENRAYSINLITNEGFNNISWKDYGL